MTKICVDCKWFREMNYTIPLPTINDYHQCQHPWSQTQHIVTGAIKNYNCMYMRSAGRSCGEDSALFQAK